MDNVSRLKRKFKECKLKISEFILTKLQILFMQFIAPLQE